MNLKLSSKLGIFVAVLVITVSSILIFVQSSLVSSNTKAVSAQNFKTISQLFTSQSSGSVRFKKTEILDVDIQKLVEQTGSSLSAIYLVGKGDEIVIQYQSNDKTTKPLDLLVTDSETNQYISDNELLISSPIFFGKKNDLVGTAYFIWNFHQVNTLIAKANRSASLLAVILVIGTLALAILVLNHLVNKPLKMISNLAEQLVDGERDLTKRINFHHSDELGTLSNLFDRFVNNVQQAIANIASTFVDLNSLASGTQINSEKILSEISVSKRSVDDAVKSVHDISQSVDHVGDTAKLAFVEANQVAEESAKGMKVVESSVSSIEKLASEVNSAAEVIERVSKSSSEIGSVLDVIKGIAEQTNLLALNAAIEAARAGEQGRGFAVVADEVRSLAAKTAQSTQEINDMIETLRQGTMAAVDVMNKSVELSSSTVEQSKQSGEVLQEIISKVHTIREMCEDISTSSETETEIAKTTVQRISEMHELMTNISNAAEDTANSGRDLNSQAQKVNAMIQEFKI